MKLSWLGFILGCISAVGFAQPLDCTAHHCMAVIDAGSTKSYLHLYQYDKNEKGEPMDIEPKWSKKISPGIASLDLKQVPAYFESLFKDAPKEAYPIYLYATGGMRLLPYVQQEKLYQSIQNWFSQQSQLQLVEAKTITGTEEGVYDWLAVHYERPGMTMPSALMGVMDMGGASVQVVLPVTNTVGLNPKDLKTIHRHGETITLFVHSFLGLGQTEISHQLIEEPGCYAKDYPMPDGSFAKGSIANCQKKLQQLLQVHGVEATVQSAVINNPPQAWFVMGGLSALASKDPFHFEGHFSAQQIFTQGESAYCEPSWSILSKQYPNDPYLATNCLATVYFNALLLQGYGLTPDTTLYYSADDQLNEWTLGVVLSQ